MQQELVWLEQGNYKYLGYTVVNATIDMSNLETTSKGIIWNPASVNKDKMCRYKVTLENKQGDTFTLEHDLIIKDIIETKQKNPSLVLQDTQTNVVAGMDGEIQTSSFLNNPSTVMSKVLGCTVYKQKERNSLIHCETPTIHYEQFNFPSLYCIKSSKSIYIGITYRYLSDRIYEHCTLTKDTTVKTGKSTFDMIAHEGAEVYCIGMFTDYTIGQIEAMSEDEKNDFKHKMESVETLMITLANKQFPDLELVNRKQILKDEDRDEENKKIVKHIANLPFINVEIKWKLLREIGFNLPCRMGKTPNNVEILTYEDSPFVYYLPKNYYDKYISIITRNKDIRHLDEDYYFDYALLTYLLLPHYTVKQSNNFLSELDKKMRRLDKREVVYLDYDTIEEQLKYQYTLAKGEHEDSDEVMLYSYYKSIYKNRHLYKFINRASLYC